jgi:hypothetical protein
VIPEETIDRHLTNLLTTSDPGDQMHHLHVIAVDRDAVGPLGNVDPTKLETSVYAIAPTGDVNPEQFCVTVIAHAAIDHIEKRKTVVWAGLSQEMWAVVDPTPESRALIRENRLQEHPDAAELTMMYAACADGRRWTGRRWLTGPLAGETEDLKIMTGPITLSESVLLPSPLIRKLVGIGD